MSKRIVYHVLPNNDYSDNDWKVKKAGSERASALFEDKEEAVDLATELAKNTGLGQIKIHGRDGKIQEERTYGKDPEKYKS